MRSDQGNDYWSARELAALLTYTEWRNFEQAIKKATQACEGSGEEVSHHFVETNKMVTLGSGAKRSVKDYRLTRYACYLIVQNADPEKEIVALGQTYFATQTRAAELAEANYLQWRHRAILSYMAKGYSQEWATTRVDGITVRNALTGEWSVRGIKGPEFAILTDRLHMGMFGLSIADHSSFKQIPVTYKGKKAVWKYELREASTTIENTLTKLGELTSRELHITNNSHGFQEIAKDVDAAGRIVADTRRQIEEATGKPVVSPRNLVNQPDGGLWAELPEPDRED